jgi:hypothetical protein
MSLATIPLAWIEDVRDLGPCGRRSHRSASAAEREAVASALELLACGRLSADYEVRPLSQGRYLLTGSLAADVTQACVITLEPVSATIEERFEVELCPPELLEVSTTTCDQAVLGMTDREPLTGDGIETGRIVFEHLSAALEPYPRQEGAELSWTGSEAEAARPKRDNPFAVLAKLKATD